MTPAELYARLAHLAGVRDPVRAAMLVDELYDLLAHARWLDAHDLDELARTVRGLGFPPRALVPRPLEPGESLLLLYQPGERTGLVRRMRTMRSGARGDTWFSGTELDRTRRGLLAELGRAGRAIRTELIAAGFDACLSPNTIVVGGSLGLSVCAAIVSAALDRAPRADTAGSAAVAADGRLLPVQGLDAKVLELRRRYPEIRRIVVARDQDPLDPALGIECVPRDSLAKALAELGLELRGLAASHVEEHLHRVASFELVKQGVPSTERWRELGWQAVESAERLSAVQRSAVAEQAALRSRSWAGLFFLHAGDVDTALAQLAQIPDDNVADGTLAALKALVAATVKIDDDAKEASVLAERAVALVGDRAEVRGKALGTFGRALMHCGSYPEAEAVLRAAAEHHEQVRPLEAPRSYTYLATCVRKQGRTSEALAIADRAVAFAHEHADWMTASTTIPYLELERGRAFLEAGDPANATIAFRRVVDASFADADYPRIAGLRGLAAASRAVGDHASADTNLRRCIMVARSGSRVIRRVAAMAIADLWLSRASTNLDDDLERVWTEATGERRDPERLGELTRAMIY